jgi:hypothetical protein
MAMGCGAALGVGVLASCGPNGEFKMPDVFASNTAKPTGAAADTGPKTAECPNFELVASQQKTNVWCWAASAEMIHRYYGRKDITQADIAKRIHGVGDDGSPKVQAASYHEIMVALNPDLKLDTMERMNEAWSKQGQHGVQIDANSYVKSVIERNSINTDDMVRELQQKHPVVIGMGKDPRFNGGHAMVVYRVTYQTSSSAGLKKMLDGKQGDQAGSTARMLGVHEFEVQSVKVMDPWTGAPMEISGADVAGGMDFLLSQAEAKKILEDEMGAIKFH